MEDKLRRTAFTILCFCIVVCSVLCYAGIVVDVTKRKEKIQSDLSQLVEQPKQTKKPEEIQAKPTMVENPDAKVIEDLVITEATPSNNVSTVLWISVFLLAVVGPRV